MSTRIYHGLLAAALLAGAAWATADFSDRFSDPKIGPKWQISGPVALDTALGHGSDQVSLRLGPKGKALLKLRDHDGAGKLSLWVNDDGTAPQNWRTRRGGPQWGLQAKDGRVVVVGSIYAPYLKGNTTFAAADYTPPKEKPWFRVQYLGLKRQTGWHRWTFDMGAEKGLSIAFDGKPVKRYNWNKSKVGGFCGIVLLGDSSEKEAQTLWVDDVEVTLGGAMTAKPTPPPPPEPLVPEKDPAVTGEAVTLLPEVAGKHPRLFFLTDDIPAFKEKALSPAMAADWKDLLGYLSACTPPKHTKFLKNATDGQRQGLWRMPSLAVHYVVTGDKKSFQRAKGFMDTLLKLPHWETTKELDAGMSSANIMIGAAICYDFLYHDLTPDFRERFRQKLLHMARAQYYGGHLNKNKSVGYWQGDPANNHRWHRNAGMSLAILTAYEGNPEEQWILNKTAEELDFVAKWLPEDGTSHEGPTYLTFGMAHLTLALTASDHCLGTDYMNSGFAKNVARYKLQTITPGFTDGFQFGDSSGVGGYNHFAWAYTAKHRQAAVQAGLKRLQANAPKAFMFGWMSILWQVPTAGKDAGIAELETTSYFPDLQLAFVRDSWEKDGVAAMFKCGPFGGLRLNEYRNQNNYRYINVAHDDPDANSFQIWSQGAMLAEGDRYSKHKRSGNYNTLLVNGKGQMVKGRREGGGWTQPATGKTDMLKMAYVTGWKEAGDVVIVEGEAGGAYRDLKRFRRTFVWVKENYILILDDIQAKSDAEFTWLLQGPELKAAGAGFELRKGAAVCPVAIVSDRPVTSRIAESTADHRGKPLGWQQLQLKAKTTAWRVVSLYNPWRREDLKVALDCSSQKEATVTVRGKGVDDSWEWTLADGTRAPSHLKGRATFDTWSVSNR
jgi:hypothetical protein